jgi:O-antigen/teichoic acid export membrane protein
VARDDASSERFSTTVLWSFLYSSAGNTASRIINALALLVVLKLISTSAFGAAGLVLAIFAVVKAVTELGLGVAIVQADELPRAVIDGLFWISLAVSAGLYALIALGAPLAAAFFREPQMTELIRGYGLIVVLFSLYFVPRNLLKRDLAFGTLAVIDNVSLLASAGLMVAFAWAGFGAWAVIVGEIGNRAGRLVGCHLVRPYWPRLQMDWAAVKPRVTFGLYATGSRLLYNLYTNADYLIVGRLFGTAAVGVYTVAYRIVSDTVRSVTSNVNDVAYPAFARLQHETGRLRRYFFTIARASLLLLGIALVVVACYVDEALAVGGYEKYLAAVPLVQIFAGVGVIRSVSPLVPQLLNAVGEARLNFWYSLSNVVVMPLAFLGGAQFGLIGVGWSWVVGYPVVVGLLFFFGARALGMGLGAFLGRAFSGLALLLPLAAAGIGVQLALEHLAGLGATATLLVGAPLTLLGGLAAAYWSERDTVAFLRERAFDNGDSDGDESNGGENDGGENDDAAPQDDALAKPPPEQSTPETQPRS